MGRVGDGRRRAEEVQSNDSGSLINFIRSNFSSRVIHHGGEGAFDHPSVSSIFSLNLLLLSPRTFPRTIIFSAKCHRTVSSLFPPPFNPLSRYINSIYNLAFSRNLSFPFFFLLSSRVRAYTFAYETMSNHTHQEE